MSTVSSLPSLSGEDLAVDGNLDDECGLVDGPLLLGDDILEPGPQLVESDHGVLVGRGDQSQLGGALPLLGTHCQPAPHLVQGRELGLVT